MFKFCRIGETNLVCYPTGLILRFDKRSKKWQICKGYKREDEYLSNGGKFIVPCPKFEIIGK